jgi:hypothetical protein
LDFFGWVFIANPVCIRVSFSHEKSTTFLADPDPALFVFGFQDADTK